MRSNVLDLRTSADLLNALGKAASRKMTFSEIREQCVSYIYGSMKPDNGLTRDEIRQFLIEREGR
jgi:hypothetical protein